MKRIFSETAQAFGKLHMSIVLAGFTGVLGKLITISEGMLVWYRMLLTLVIFFCLLLLMGRFRRVSWGDFAKIGGIGVVLCLHWLFFYGSIKTSNISIGVVCFALVGFYTALLEPLIMHRRLSLRELLFSVLTLLGVALIFSFDARYRLGITLGVISSFLAALYTVCNKRICAGYSSSTLLLYQMAGGVIFLSLILPFYIHYFKITYIVPNVHDTLLLFCLVFFCTIVMNLLQIQSLRHISAFTVNLSYNLEPVYSIMIAIVFLSEAQQLQTSFYVGLSCILLSVGLQSYFVLRERRAVPQSS